MQAPARTDEPTTETAGRAEIAIPAHVLFRSLGDEAVVLDLDSGRYFGLDETATRFWQLLEEHGALEPAVQAMHDEFDASIDVLRADLSSFVTQLAENKLLDVR